MHTAKPSDHGLRNLAISTTFAAAACTHAWGQLCPSGFPPSALPLDCGMGAATCFSGFENPFNPASGIDPNGFSLAVVDFRDPATNSPGNGVNWCAPMFHNEFPVTADTWNATNLGQVFGIALDDANPPNIYVTATTTYGSNVASYQNGNTTAFSVSPFGPGGAGAVYQLNGTTGAISVFASLPNSGPGLGNIGFDAGFDAFYVSNFEDGRVYRLDSSGACLSTYDHATDVVAGCAPETGDPDGFVPLRERVWAVKTFGDRLYYSLWIEDRGRPAALMQNEVWSVQLDGSGQFIANTRQLEISVPSYLSGIYSNPVSDISFSAAGRMMLAERNMRADVGSGQRLASALDGHRSRNLEYELIGSVWTASTRTFFIGTSGSGLGTNAAGGTDYDCEDNLWSTGDQLISQGSPIQYAYGLQRTPEPGNTTTTIASTGYFIDLDGIGTVQTKNRVGDVVVHNRCCDCMTVNVLDIECEFDATGLTGKYTVTAEVTNDSGVTAQYVLLPNAETVPNIIPLVPPLPSGTGEVRTITFQICDVPPGTNHCFDVLLADEQVEECCAIEVCVDVPECDCMIISDVTVECDSAGDIVLNFTFTNLTPEIIEHLFVIKPLPPDPNAGIVIDEDYWDLTGSPVPPFTSGSIGPIVISGAVPGSELCLLISIHDELLVECCSELLCFKVPVCDPTDLLGACCLPDGTCVQATLLECEMMLGLFLGVGTPCTQCGGLTPIGACCRDDGSCTEVSAFECGAIGGIYLGDGAPCADCPMFVPLGACCQADGSCVQTSAVGCASTGGTFLGPGTPCSQCEGVGACCLPGLPCMIVSSAECAVLGGSFFGVGSDCAQCNGALACPADLDGSRDVGFGDVLQVIGAWGPCGVPCPEDLSQNGVVDFADILEVLAAWGPCP